MNKRDLIKGHVRLGVWKIVSTVYGIRSPAPVSNSQEKLLDEISEFVADMLCDSMTKEEIESKLRSRYEHSNDQPIES